MGVWGAGLYSSDLALDLKAAIKAILRAPLTPEIVVRELKAAFPAADQPTDEDYTTFWLVLADQFHAAGVSDDDVLEQARDIIAAGADAEMMRKLDMAPSVLRKREAALAELAVKWKSPSKGRRKVLKEPELHAFPVGACVAYPLMGTEPINPYFRSPDQMIPPFVADGWGAFVVLRNFQVHDVLAMTMIAVLAVPRVGVPNLHSCRIAPISLFKPFLCDTYSARVAVGTFSTVHAKRMRCENLGLLRLDEAAVKRRFPIDPDPPRYADVSVCSYLGPQQNAPADVQAQALRIEVLCA